MKAIIKYPGESPGRIEDIPNTLEALQGLVDGHIETVTLPTLPPVIIICDEEGMMNNRPYNCRVDGVRFLGTIVVVGADSEDFADCPLTLEEWKELIGT